MSKKLSWLVCFVLSLSLARNASASLIAHWTFEDGGGTTVTDVTDNGYDGTISGDPQWVDGEFAGGLRFDGVDDSAVYLFAQAEDWSAYTVTVWTKAESLAQANYKAVFASTVASGTGFQIDVDGGDPGNYRYHPDDGDQVIGPVTLEWVHLAASCDGTDTSLYYDGTLAATIDRAHPQFSKLAVGVNRNVTQWFNGILDDFRLYDEALTDEEIAGLMLNQGPAITTARRPGPADGVLYEATWVTLTRIAAPETDLLPGERIDAVIECQFQEFGDVEV
ncbi:MAG: LamG domain-containing protein, partial [Sedimentisphaerales bacterium]